jgi:hypothetical protein
MSYIGQQLPADVFSGYVTDTFTGDGSATTFTLSKAPFSEDSLIVVIDNVIQQPTVNFTVSGTTLTIVGTAILSGIKGYAIHTGGPVASTLASKVDVNGLSDGVILDADGDTTISADTDDQIDIKIAGADDFRFSANAMNVLSGSTLTIDSGATITNSGTATGFTDNTPAFQAFLNSSQTTNSGAEAVIIFNTEQIDTDSAYDTSNGKFTVPSGEGGKYFIFAQLMRGNFFGGRFIVKLNVGGTEKASAEMRNSDTGGTTFDTVNISALLDLSAGNEVTVSMYQNAGDGSGANGDGTVPKSFFMGFKIGA